MSKIKKAAVIGAGIMGNGIVQVLAQVGFEVAMTDIEDKFIQRGIASIKKSLGRMKKRGKIAEDEAEKVFKQLREKSDQISEYVDYYLFLCVLCVLCGKFFLCPSSCIFFCYCSVSLQECFVFL